MESISDDSTAGASPPSNASIPSCSPFAKKIDQDDFQQGSWRPKPLSAVETDKVMQILQACRDRDLEALSALATSEHGLIEDEIRRTACESPLRN